MRYLVLLYGDEATMPQPGTPEGDADMAAFEAFDALAGESILGGEALGPAATARTIRLDAGEVRITEGPYAETTEVLGGFFVVEVPSLDDAIALAEHIPVVDYGSIEIRPIVEWHGRDVPAGVPRFVATIHGPETEAEDPGSAAWDAGAAEHGAFGASAGSALVGAAAVHPTRTATVVRRREGSVQVTDGPFAEGAEVIGGLYVLAGSESEVVALAREVPLPEGGAVEVRPALVFDG